MTAVAIWYNEIGKGVWAVSDTLLSKSDGAGELIKDASKVLPLTVARRQVTSQDKDIEWSAIRYGPELGFCFAGSSLVAQNIYLALVPLLGNVKTFSEDFVPKLASVAEYVFSYSCERWEDYKYTLGEAGLFELGLFGYCLVEKKFSVYLIRFEKSDGVYELKLHAHENLKDNDFFYLGDQREKVEELIGKEFASGGKPGRPVDRAPKNVLGDLINDPNWETIGGGMQLAISTSLGLEMYATCTKLGSQITYLGRPLDTVGKLDEGMPLGNFIY
ncbi:hypothetical protein SAMN05444141_102309 [Pseudovibrio denitrificans]|uniref:Uncharacterized protein n=1 Tax=Pseudovibrio denitrificans TaxID=258256 RepID=A0A1I6ZFR5_9HYPH|nr:hypothetical protein [Pseudovibrio denitrificans]SFT61499.1 hypothetical protein SAMN05444141_102309 [Pseudovibrio denitrificans]